MQQESKAAITPIVGFATGKAITGGKEIATYLRRWIVFLLKGFLTELPEDLGERYNLISKVVEIWKIDEQVSVGLIQNTILLLNRRMALCTENRKGLVEIPGRSGVTIKMEGLFSDEEITRLVAMDIEAESEESDLSWSRHYNPITFAAMERVVLILTTMLVQPTQLIEVERISPLKGR